MGTHHYNLSEQFEFTGKVKILSIVGIVIGIATIAYGLFLNNDHITHERTFANLLLMGYYFACVSLFAVPSTHQNLNLFSLNQDSYLRRVRRVDWQTDFHQTAYLRNAFALRSTIQFSCGQLQKTRFSTSLCNRIGI